jgi:two-component system invasion response regulator UvrY
VNGLPMNGRDSNTSVHVLIVDDQPTFRVAIRAVVGRLRDFTLVGEAGSGEEAIDRVDELKPDLVLMDINMGAVDGIEATRHIVAAHPQVMVVLLSTYGAQDLPSAARKSGAAAYLHKDELSPGTIRRVWEAGGDPAWKAG